MPWALTSDTVPPASWWPTPGLIDGVGDGILAGPSAGFGAAPAVTDPRPQTAQPALAGSFQPLFDSDFYGRLHLSVSLLSLGAVVGEQLRVVSAWNAYGYGVTLEELQLVGAEGIVVDGQLAPPLDFSPLQERAWNITVTTVGPPTIDASVSWVFDQGTTLRLSIVGARVVPWVWRPDWSKGVTLAHEWLTDIIEAEYGDEQRIAMRVTPRESWEFTASATGTDRQAMEAATLGWGARTWALPLWPHGADLSGDLPAGATSVPIQTLARDFRDGGLAMLVQEGQALVEVVEVQTVQAGALILRRPTRYAWPAGAVIYPAKPAKIDTDPTFGRFTGMTADVRMRFMVQGANPYPELEGLPQYRGYGVLEDIPDWSSEPQATFGRKFAELDNRVGVPMRVDRSGVPIIRTAHRLGPIGRAQLDRVRRLQYLLKGMRGAVWVPTWTDDLTLRAVAAIGAESLDVTACGYTAHLRGMIHRRDIRVESAAGVEYHRITGSVELDGGLERLGLAEPLLATLNPSAPGGVRISFLTLYRQDSDRNEWAWWSGDLGGDNAHADVPVPMRTFTHDV